MVEVVTISLERLQPHPDNPRLALRDDVIASLAAQMEDGGFDPLYPILARPFGDDYQIVSGHHRCKAAETAGLTEVPCCVRDMSDEVALMALVESNAQGELSGLEIGLHALGMSRRYGEVSDYARRVGKSKQQVSNFQRAARVYARLTGERTVNCTSFRIAGKTTHLEEIGLAPEECWLLLVETLADDKITVAKVRNWVRELNDLKAAMPSWWKIEFGAVVHSIFRNDGARTRELAKFAEANRLYHELPEHVASYEYVATEEVIERDGREYRLHKPVYRSDYRPRDAFVEEIFAYATVRIDDVRKAYRDVLAHINACSPSSDKFEPVLTEREYAAKLEAERMAEQERTKDEAGRRVLHGSCIDALNQWHGGTIHALVTDPPYGVDYLSTRRTATDYAPKIVGDRTMEGACELLAEMLNAARPHMAEDAHLIVFTSDVGVRAFWDVLADAGFRFKRLLVWVKPNHTVGDTDGGFAPRKELAIHAVKGTPGVSPRSDDVCIQAKTERESHHPMEKPVEVLQYWLGSIVNEGDLVIDPFCGTGSTLVAAARLRCRFWGAELDECYHAKAVERVRNAVEASAAVAAADAAD